ncbi:hypothetical protein LTR85_011635 [Meristemomyces frigidus]|nr:hypothetical protein LTR85_011635 [Meristemomyces frigidus]
MLGLSGNAYYGFDTISLGLVGSGLPTLQNQLIAGIASNSFWLGSLGLSPYTFNLTNLDNPLPSLMGTLRNQSIIPSMSWAYTAGAYYRDPPVLASLTLGGFDATRFTANNVSFAFGADFSRDLLVSLTSVTYDTVGSSPLLAQSISIFIDSLVTELWLPISVCQAFETAFNLTWNSTAQLYLISDDVHKTLAAQNPTFTFTLAQAGESSGGAISDGTVEIALPYAAFDLDVFQPLVDSTTRYFPLKQAQNSSQYTLGRTFLQEAYIIADYDHGNFSVSQAQFPDTSVAAEIISIYPPTVPESSKHSVGRFSAGVFAGIVVGAVTVLLLAAGLWTWLMKRRSGRLDKPEDDRGGAAEPKNAVQGESLLTYPQQEADSQAVHEMDHRNGILPELSVRRGIGERQELAVPHKVQELGAKDEQVAFAELEAPS